MPNRYIPGVTDSSSGIKPPPSKAKALGQREKRPPVHIPTAKPPPRRVPLPPVLDPSRITPQTVAAARPAVRALPPPPSVLPHAELRPLHVDHTKRFDKPLFPGQKPDGYITHGDRLLGGRGAPALGTGGLGGPKGKPYYLAHPGAAGNDRTRQSEVDVARTAAFRQKQLGTAGVILRDTATSLVPTTLVDVAAGRSAKAGTILKDAGAAALNFAPGLKVAGVLGAAGLRGSQAAKAFVRGVNEGKSVAEAAKVARAVGGPRASTITKVTRSFRADLKASPSRTVVHDLLDGQLPKAAAKTQKDLLDHGAASHARVVVRETGDPKQAAHAVDEYFSGLHDHMQPIVPGAPRSYPQAVARLNGLDRQINAFVDKVAEKVGHPSLGSAKDMQREQLVRNERNAKFDRQQAGVNRAGKKAGYSGDKIQGRLPLVSQELKDHAMQTIMAAVEVHPDVPELKRFAELLAERDSLDYAVKTHQEQQFGALETDSPVDFGRHPGAALPDPLPLEPAVAEPTLAPEPLAAEAPPADPHPAPVEPTPSPPTLDAPIDPPAVPPPVDPPTTVGGHPDPSSDPNEIVRQALGGARIVRGRQEAGYAAERSARGAAFSQALHTSDLHTAGDVQAAFDLASGELKGELPKIDFAGFKELNPDALAHLGKTIIEHPYLMPFQKKRTWEALNNAVEGKVPTRSELDLLQHVFGKQTATALGDVHKLSYADKFVELLNVPRSLMASFDLSAPFRQGLVISTSHPVIFAKNFLPMLKSFKNEDYFRAIMEDIGSRPTYPMMVDAKLALTEAGPAADLALREEGYYGAAYAEKIPVIGRGVKASERAYVAFLDKTRADVFDHLVRVASSNGVNVQDEKFLKSLGKFINSATGRGTFNSKVVEESMPILNALLFSPRLLASRLNFLSPRFYMNLDPFVRKEALRSAIQLAGGVSTVLGLAAMAGAKVQHDPRNADFAKIRVGTTRFDVLGGFQQPLRLIAQVTSGKAISSTTGKTLTLGPQGPGALSRKDIIQRFFEGKLAPTPSMVNDFFKGTDFQGQPFSVKKEAITHMIPLLAQDSASLYQEKHGGVDGISWALGGYVVGGIGLGMQTYGPKPPAKNTASLLGPNSSGGIDSGLSGGIGGGIGSAP